MNSHKKKKKVIITASVLATAVICVVGIGLIIHRKQMQSAHAITSSQQEGTANNTTAQSAETQAATSTTTNTPATMGTAPVAQLPAPPQPVLTKSSGNNGAIPVNVSVNFICSSQAGLVCQIILTSGAKQIILTDQTITDSGRGQAYTGWYWQSVAGKWTVIARAKNSQGTGTDSIPQTLEVK